MDEGLLSPTEQRSLAERVFAGDRAAEDELVRWFHPRIFATVVCRTGDREASRDLVQDVLVATLRALRQGALDDPDKLSHFIQGIARNLANSHIRTVSIRRPREDALPPELADRMAAPVRKAEAESAVLEQHVEYALHQLEADDRQILLMTMEGRKPREIAEKMALTSEVVRQRKCRAIQRIKDSLKKVSRMEWPNHLPDGKGPA